MGRQAFEGIGMRVESCIAVCYSKQMMIGSFKAVLFQRSPNVNNLTPVALRNRQLTAGGSRSRSGSGSRRSC